MNKPVRQAQVDRIVRAGREATTAVEHALDHPSDIAAEQRANRAVAVWLRVSQNSSEAEFGQAWERLVGPAPPSATPPPGGERLSPHASARTSPPGGPRALRT